MDCATKWIGLRIAGKNQAISHLVPKRSTE
jgi:hypothetical protein